MTNLDPKVTWQAYCDSELSILRPILNAHEISLDEEQKHMQGERYLMQAVTTASGVKLILTGSMGSKGKVVIKASRDEAGIREILHERTCREILKKINFAGSIFHTPTELLFLQKQGFIITAQAFIDQSQTFLERPIEEQFTLALRAFKAQESAHATTSRHRSSIKRVFAIRTAKMYLHAFQGFMANIHTARPEDTNLHELLNRALTLLRQEERVIEQYSGFLTHTDFVPHNIRIHNDTIFLLDHSSLAFGNKYEGWARFLNFMSLYNPPLEEALVTYVKINRTDEESVALRMMRIYRLGEIIWYYIQTLDKSAGDLHTLNAARVTFWSSVLHHLLNNEKVPITLIQSYQNTRDTLRSDDEKRRQRGLH